MFHLNRKASSRTAVTPPATRASAYAEAAPAPTSAVAAQAPANAGTT